jgi:NTP pyrophosphatase (non-canonical NTP hydrolase)
MNKQKLMKNIRKWSDFQFNNGIFNEKRSISISYHLQKEVKELTEILELYFNNPSEQNKNKILEELADCNMLLDDCASHMKFTAKDIYKAEINKLEINKKRIWGNPDENGVVEHIKD